MKISNFLNCFERDMRVKRMAESTVANYSSQVKSFLHHFADRDSPKHISTDEIKDYLLRSGAVNSQRHAHSAIKRFYTYTVGQPRKMKHIEYAKKDKALPQVIDKGRILAAIRSIANLKHKAIITLAYSTGMRVSEVCNLKIADVDSTRMVITIRQAKGRKDRIVPLSPTTLHTLRQYFRQYRPKEYLLPAGRWHCCGATGGNGSRVPGIASRSCCTRWASIGVCSGR